MKLPLTLHLRPTALFLASWSLSACSQGNDASSPPPEANGGTAAAMSGGSTSTTGNGGMSPLGTGGQSPEGSGGMTDSSGGAPPSAGGSSADSGGGDASGGEAAAAGGAAPLGELTVSALNIELNPQMPLGAFVTWTTDEAANSEVQFGIDGLQYRIIDAEEVTDHRVYVLGMRAETLYDLQATSTNADATGSAAGEVTTGMLPPALPSRAEVVTPAAPGMQAGYTLTNFWDTGNSPTVVIMLDTEGYPIWFFENGPSSDQFGATSVEWTHDSTILVGNAGDEPAREVDLEGNVLWEGPTGGADALSHDTTKLRTGNYLVARESASSARVEEIDPAGAVVWSWDLYQDSSVTNDGANDWCHLNSISTDASEEFVYFNCRYQGLFKIDKSEKTLLWQMGAAMDDDQSGDITYLPDNTARFNDAHDPEAHEDGTILFYDNQGWSNRNEGQQNGSYKTQVVEYQFDETTKEATLVWQFPGNLELDPWYTEGWSTPIWGDADRLENGNVLVTAGVTGNGNGGGTPPGTKTRIFEVTRDGEVVWAIEWPDEKGSYRAMRVMLPVEPLL